MASSELFHHPHDGSKHLLGTMARQKLVQDAFPEDVPDVTTCIEQQLQYSKNRDKSVLDPVSSDYAHSDQVNLVWMHNPNGVAEVLVAELWTEVDRNQ